MNLKYIKILTIFIMSIFYVRIGVLHFTNPQYFLNIMPPYLPFHLELVYLSGFLEIFLGVLLLIKKYRFYAGWGIILLLIAVFPANIYLAQSIEAQTLLGITQKTAILRLPFQIPMLLLAYWHTKSFSDIL